MPQDMALAASELYLTPTRPRRALRALPGPTDDPAAAREAVAAVWTRYRRWRRVEDRNTLVVYYAPLVKYVVGRAIPASVRQRIENPELVSCGMLGLIEAIERFPGDDPADFPRYAPFRIRGSIMDELRRQDWVPRAVREKAKALEAARERLEAQLLRSPERTDLARAMGLAEAAFDSMLTEVAAARVLRLEPPGGDRHSADWSQLIAMTSADESPDEAVLARAVRDQVRDAMARMDRRERQVLVLYYLENLNQSEVGAILGVSNSRVSQITKRALRKLRAMLEEQDSSTPARTTALAGR